MGTASTTVSPLLLHYYDYCHLQLMNLFDYIKNYVPQIDFLLTIVKINWKIPRLKTVG